jgi:hypothetical protein
MRNNTPTPGLIHYRTQQQLRVLDEFVQMNQRIGDRALAQLRDGTTDAAGVLLAQEHLAEAMDLTLALQERIKQQAAARKAGKAPKRRVSLGRPVR